MNGYFYFRKYNDPWIYKQFARYDEYQQLKILQKNWINWPGFIDNLFESYQSFYNHHHKYNMIVIIMVH